MSNVYHVCSTKYDVLDDCDRAFLHSFEWYASTNKQRDYLGNVLAEKWTDKAIFRLSMGRKHVARKFRRSRENTWEAPKELTYIWTCLDQSE